MFPKAEVDNLLRSIGRNFNAVNQGGCAFMAEIVADTIAPHLESYKIRSCGSKGACIDEVRSKIQNRADPNEWFDNGVGLAHFWVEGEVDGKMYAFDAEEGMIPAELMHMEWGHRRLCEGSFTKEEVHDMARFPKGGWNPRFNTRQVPKMRKAMEEGVRRINF